jgi:carbonic anhydrase
MNNLKCFTLALSLVAFFGCAVKSETKNKLHELKSHKEIHWGYSGESGPEHWGDLKREYHMCKEGKNQSPIDITSAIEIKNSPLLLSYENAGEDFLYNGHALQVNYDKGSSFSVDGHVFELKQFHFHTPSENTIDGKHFPMEAHLVHTDKSGNLAVIALMFKEGKNNPLIDELLKVLPKKTGEDNRLPKSVNVADLVPKDGDYYRFNGSLTTPPCSEGVLWLVMKKPIEASKEQIELFSKVMGKNNRPVQPLNARVVLK